MLFRSKTKDSSPAFAQMRFDELARSEWSVRGIQFWNFGSKTSDMRDDIGLAFCQEASTPSTLHPVPGPTLKMVLIAQKGIECDCKAWEESSTNPLNWSRPRKWRITLTACYMSSLISIAASAYSLGVDQMVVDLEAPRLLVISGISLWVFREARKNVGPSNN